MTLLHRFCAFFPLLLLIVVLGGCQGGGSAWTPAGKGTVDAGTGPYPDAPFQSPPVSETPSVKVAILLPLSGQNAALGQSMLEAAQLALFDAGYDNLELTPKDTQGSPQAAALAADQALDEGAKLILGPVFADEVRAAKPVAAGRGVPMIAFSTDWTLADNNTLLMGFMPFTQVQRIVSFAAAKGIKQPAIIAPDDLYGRTASRIFEEEAMRRGLPVKKSLSVYSLNAAGPPPAGSPLPYDSVFIPASGTALTDILASLKANGLSTPSIQKLGTGLWDDARLAANPDLQGALFAAPAPRARLGFENRYKSTYGKAPVRIASLAYDATALAAALAKAGTAKSGQPDYSRAALGNPNGFAGIDGIFRFAGNGQVERGLAILQISNGRVIEIDPAPMSFQKLSN